MEMMSRKEILKLWLNEFSEFWWGDHNDIRFKVCEMIQSFKNKRVVDIGCNVGLVTYIASINNDAYGFDISDKALAIANKKYGESAEFINADWLDTPYVNDTFDVALMLHVVEGARENLRSVLSEVNRMLKPKGELVITTPSVESCFFSQYNKLSKEELIIHLNDSGFNIKSVYGWNEESQLIHLMLNLFNGNSSSIRKNIIKLYGVFTRNKNFSHLSLNDLNMKSKKIYRSYLFVAIKE